MKKLSICIFFAFLSISCKEKETEKVTPKPIIEEPEVSNFAKGADVGWITQMEASGRKFYSSSGSETEGITLLKSLGMNTIRLRVWVNPTPAYNNTADVVAKALRAKNLGMRIMIDFHYSDSWADPGKQTKPAAWVGQDLEGLKTSISNHTTQVLTELKNNGITPEWVQVGNETNDGMLWPEGRASTNMKNFSEMVNSGYDAVKLVFPTAKVIVHISNGWDNGLFRYLFDGLKVNGGKYDVIGMSLYPNPTNWASFNNQCLTNMNDMVARYNKDVMIVEIGMSWDSADDSKLFIADIITKTKSIAGEKGLGVLYWEPLSCNNWQGYTLGALDNSGKPTVALDVFAD